MKEIVHITERAERIDYELNDWFDGHHQKINDVIDEEWIHDGEMITVKLTLDVKDGGLY